MQGWHREIEMGCPIARRDTRIFYLNPEKHLPIYHRTCQLAFPGDLAQIWLFNLPLSNVVNLLQLKQELYYVIKWQENFSPPLKSNVRGLASTAQWKRTVVMSALCQLPGGPNAADAKPNSSLATANSVKGGLSFPFAEWREE